MNATPYNYIYVAHTHYLNIYALSGTLMPDKDIYSEGFIPIVKGVASPVRSKS